MPYYDALPTGLRPTHYDLAIADIDVAAETFSGTVAIALDVVEATDELHLNYRDLTVSKERIAVTEDGAAVDVVELTHFEKKEYFVVKFGRQVAAGTKLAVTIAYTAVIQTNMAGFYKSSYVQDGETRDMVSTQFEATDARRAFPCLDEPGLKATFDLTLTVPKELVALANTPVAAGSEKVEGDLKTVTFERTPIMSTYLLAWAVGEFEYIESFTQDNYNGAPLPVRVYTTPGHTKDAQFASTIAPKIVDYFSQVFGLPYPLAKLDLIAVHSFSHNAMENWGLITYRATALLFSEEKLDPSYKQKVAYVVAHELAHQWFGNLVTMKWWDELWLNEGFATWVGFAAVDFLFPEWDIFSGFISDSMQQALKLDSLRNSHPIEVPVVDALDIDQVFDAISYLKGASTILMLSTYLGRDVFLKGVSLYLQRHQFSNATSADLWGAVGEVSGKPVASWMESWIKKVGYPVVNVETSGDNLVISQQRFLAGGDATPEENTSRWWIPLNASSESTRPLVDSFELERLIVDNFPLEGFFKLNSETSGAYRVSYSQELWEKHVLPYFGKLSAKDKVGLLADTAANAVAGNVSTTTFLSLVPQVQGDEYVVWLELGRCLSEVSNVFAANGEFAAILKAFKRSVYEDKAIDIINKLKANEVDGSDFLAVKLRSSILGHAASLAIPAVEQYATELFDQWVAGTAIPPSLRSFVFTTIAASSSFNDAQFEQILKEVTDPTSLDSREVALGALGHVSNKEIADKLISLLLRPEVIPTMDSHFVAVPLSKNPVTKDAFWTFFSTNYDALYKLMAANMVVLDRFVKVTLCNYQSIQKHDEIAAFFADKDVHGFERAYKQALDTIKINAQWFGRDGDVVRQFLHQ